MSGNIHDTKVRDLRREISSFVTALKANPEITGCETKYSVLFNTSRALFGMIDREVRQKITNETFDELEFNTRVSEFLRLIESVQNGRITQYAASGIVGGKLAEQYIDVCKKGKDTPER